MSLASVYAVLDACGPTSLAPLTLEHVRALKAGADRRRKDRIEHARRATAAGMHDLARAYRRQAAAADRDLEELERAESDLEMP